MAKYALLEKAKLLLAHNRKTEAIQTVQRIKQMPGSDPSITMKLQAVEKEATKG
jgi:C4-dicarboxylate-specific signal transduction histidine kinase